MFWWYLGRRGNSTGGGTMADKEHLEAEESFYSRANRELLLEQDALRNEEDGFMQGYEEGFADVTTAEELGEL